MTHNRLVLIPLADAAKIAGGVSVRTLEREHAAGRLAIVRIRSRRFVTGAELDRYITEQTCRFEKSETVGKFDSASAVADALSALYRRAQPAPMPRRSSIRSAARGSMLRLVESQNSR